MHGLGACDGGAGERLQGEVSASTAWAFATMVLSDEELFTAMAGLKARETSEFNQQRSSRM